MTRLPLSIAAVLVAAAASGQDLRFVPGQGSAESLSDADRAAALLAIDTLSAEIGVPKDRILIDTVRAVDWRDSSLGCPKPGMAYLDVITPGHKVTLRADGQIHVVHEAKNRAFVCSQAKALGGMTASRELVFGRQLAEARKDLAGRLNAPEDEIRFLASEGQSWPDASLGCPEPGRHYPPARIFGWKMTFSYRDRVYTYHTDLERTIPCPAITAD
jgi:hypothetical protein